MSRRPESPKPARFRALIVKRETEEILAYGPGLALHAHAKVRILRDGVFYMLYFRGGVGSDLFSAYIRDHQQSRHANIDYLGRWKGTPLRWQKNFSGDGNHHIVEIETAGDFFPRVDKKTFKGLRYLTSVILARNTRYVDNYAFEDCGAMERLIIKSNEILLGSSALRRDHNKLGFDYVVELERGVKVRGPQHSVDVVLRRSRANRDAANRWTDYLERRMIGTAMWVPPSVRENVEFHDAAEAEERAVDY